MFGKLFLSLLLFALPAHADFQATPKIPVASVVTNQFLTGITAAGAVTQAQPAFSNLSGSWTVSQYNSGTGATSSTFARGDGTWAAPPGAPTYLAKSADYTLTTSDSTVGFDASVTGRLATLPTAVGNSGLILKVIKTDTTANAVTIATTSGQTVGGRASSSITLTRAQNMVQVQSDGANWQILDKREFGYLSSATSMSMSTAGAAANYGTLACSVALTYGLWEVTGYFTINVSTGTGVGLNKESGFFGADGANSASAPTALGGTISGDASWTSVSAGAALLATGASASTRWPANSNKILIQVTSTTNVFLVPNVQFTLAGAATVFGYLQAVRIF